MKYRIVYTYVKYEDDIIEADNASEAKVKWENEGYDADLFYIEDEEGKQVFFNQTEAALKVE